MKTSDPAIFRMQSDLNRLGFYITPDDLMWMLMGLRMAVVAAGEVLVVEMNDHAALEVQPDGNGGASFALLHATDEEEGGDEQPLFN